jgi:predicted secreted protein
MVDLTLTEADDGGRVAVAVGDTIALALPDLASGGYRWTITRLDRDHLALEDEAHASGSEAIGSSGTARWRFRALRAGVTRVELTRARPWETSGQSSRFTVTLDVTA